MSSVQALVHVTLLAAEEGHEEVNQALSWGIGGLSLGILLALLIALAAFGGGREHS
jgi:hypothetical protein